MDKDEMKNRISMALKDPILQQGFEIICKENAELKEKSKRQSNNYKHDVDMLIESNEQNLTKAREIIKDLTSSYGSTEVSEAQLYLKIKKAEQFLKDSEVEK